MKITLKIKGTFGSKKQEAFATSTLRLLLSAWQMQLHELHKKNDIDIDWKTEKER